MSLEFLISASALAFIIGIHEFGHYLFARMCKVGVEIFSIGFGPVIWSRTDKKGTKWQLCLIPLGGYIYPKDEGNAIGLKFKEAGMIRGCLVAFAGPLFNFVTAFLCLLFVCIHVGTPKISSEIKYVKPDSPAWVAHMQKGDKIIAINEKSLANIESLTVMKNPTIKVQRNNDVFEITLNKPKYKLAGFNLKFEFSKLSFFKSVEYSFSSVTGGVYITLSRIWSAITSFNVMGPVGILKSATSAQEGGWISFILFIASISIAIGSMNLLPIPMLDGGRIIMFIASAILGRPISTFAEKILNYASLAVIGTIFAIGFFVDLQGLV